MIPEIPQNLTNICEDLLLSNKSMSNKSKSYFTNLEKPHTLVPDSYYTRARCEDLQRGFVLEALREEMEFPIAFSLLVYKDTEQIYRLLRAIYRPSNYYCIHVDAKVNLYLSSDDADHDIFKYSH